MAVTATEVTARIFESVVKPLVLGGPMQLARPLGWKRLQVVTNGTPPPPDSDYNLMQRTRVQVARKLVPLDWFDDLSHLEWHMAGAVHDLLLAPHPEFQDVLGRRGRRKLLLGAKSIFAAIPQPVSIREALSRHSLFARIFEIPRTHSFVSWWTGSEKFIGQDPPARLLAWPELRRVNVSKTQHLWFDLPLGEHNILRDEATTAFLEASPLTDLASCTRSYLPFLFREGLLGVLALPTGRALAIRMLQRLPDPIAVDTVFGRAVAALMLEKKWREVGVVVEFLRDRELARFLASDPSSERIHSPNPDAARTRGFACSAIEALASKGALGLRPFEAEVVKKGVLGVMSQAEVKAEVAAFQAA
jgi:hypothetical protein